MGRTSLKTRIAISKRRTRLPQTSYNLNPFDASYKSHTSPAIGPEHLLVCNLMQSIWHEKSLRAAKPPTSHVHFSWGIRIFNANVIIAHIPHQMFHIPACLNRGQASPANPQEVCQKHFGPLSLKSLIVNCEDEDLQMLAIIKFRRSTVQYPLTILRTQLLDMSCTLQPDSGIVMARASKRRKPELQKAWKHEKVLRTWQISHRFIASKFQRSPVAQRSLRGVISTYVCNVYDYMTWVKTYYSFALWWLYCNDSCIMWQCVLFQPCTIDSRDPESV